MNKILKIAQNNNGFVTRKMLINNRINPSLINNLLKNNTLRKSDFGVYVIPEVFDDEYFNYQVRFKKGIYSLGTALYLHQMTDRIPIKIEMSFSQNYNTSILPDDIIPHRESIKLFGIGKENIKTPSKNTVTAYSIERTLCDILRPVNKVDISIITDAYKMYSLNKKHNLHKLYKYSKLLNVEKSVQKYMEILL
jgi:hypothetical protein